MPIDNAFSAAIKSIYQDSTTGGPIIYTNDTTTGMTITLPAASSGGDYIYVGQTITVSADTLDPALIFIGSGNEWVRLENVERKTPLMRQREQAMMRLPGENLEFLFVTEMGV